MTWRILVAVIISALGLGACKSEIESQLYVSDVEALISDGKAGSVEATITAYAPGLAEACDKAWNEFGPVFSRYFKQAKLEGCKKQGFEDGIIVNVMIPLQKAPKDDGFEDPSIFVIFARDTPTPVSVKGKSYTSISVMPYVNRNRVNSLEADLKRVNMMASINRSQLAARVVLRNDKRDDVLLSVHGVFIGAETYPKHEYVTVAKRKDAPIRLSDVHVAHLLGTGATHPMSLLVEPK